MNTPTYYRPVRDFPGYICCLNEEDAQEQKKALGGQIIKVPIFTSRKDAIDWIKKRQNPKSWNIEEEDSGLCRKKFKQSELTCNYLIF